MKRHFAIFLAILLSGLFGMPLLAQNEGRSSGIIGSRDTVEIRVFREGELTTRSQLSGSGTVTMPLIGAIRIRGMSTDSAASLIERKLRDGYLVRPQVSVSIEARIRRTITVLGQVREPGVFELSTDRQLSLIEAIGMAGGMTRISNPKKVSLKRRGSAAPIRVNVKDITAGKASDITLREGDIITIPESLF